MRINGTINEDKKGSALYVAVIFLLMLGTAAGSVYLAKNSTNMGDSIKEYFSSFFSAFSEQKNSAAVFRNALRTNILSALIIFVMGFFRLGCIGTGAVIVRKGFITGFTAASFLECYGARGMMVMLASMPSAIISIPIMLIFSVVSVRFAMNEGKKSKKLLISYIFFLFFVISIFCVAALAEGYLTTIFMERLSPNFT